MGYLSTGLGSIKPLGYSGFLHVSGRHSQVCSTIRFYTVKVWSTILFRPARHSEDWLMILGRFASRFSAQILVFKGICEPLLYSSFFLIFPLS